MPALFTIGYEGAALDDFVDTLIEAGVEHVVDIRALPQSRRPGFSKSPLSAALTEAGIGYHHVRQLGDPKEGRDAARNGDIAGFKKIFSTHMAQQATQQALAELADFVAELPSALLCFERNHKYCHRSLVAEHVSALISFPVRHLGVIKGLAKGRSADAERIGGDARAY
jgi:uncharacterized protein (DUF488 family)